MPSKENPDQESSGDRHPPPAATVLLTEDDYRDIEKSLAGGGDDDGSIRFTGVYAYPNSPGSIYSDMNVMRFFEQNAMRPLVDHWSGHQKVYNSPVFRTMMKKGSRFIGPWEARTNVRELVDRVNSILKKRVEGLEPSRVQGDVDVLIFGDKDMSRLSSLHVRAMMSLATVLQHGANVGHDYLIKKLPPPYDRAPSALDLDRKLFDQEHVLSDYLTVDRFRRSLNGTFVVSPGTHKRRHSYVLVRADSWFVENVIGRFKNDAEISLFVIHEKVPSGGDLKTQLAEGDVLYIELPLVYVLMAVDNAAKQAVRLEQASDGDVV